MMYQIYGVIWVISGLIWIGMSITQVNLGNIIFGKIIALGGIGIIICGFLLFVLKD